MKRVTRYHWLAVLFLLFIGISAQTRFGHSDPSKRVSDGTSSLSVLLDQPVPRELWPKVADTYPMKESGMPEPNYSDVVQFNSFDDRVKNLQAVTQQKIVFPEGFTDFIH